MTQTRRSMVPALTPAFQLALMEMLQLAPQAQRTSSFRCRETNRRFLLTPKTSTTDPRHQSLMTSPATQMRLPPWHHTRRRPQTSDRTASKLVNSEHLSLRVTNNSRLHTELGRTAHGSQNSYTTHTLVKSRPERLWSPTKRKGKKESGN